MTMHPDIVLVHGTSSIHLESILRDGLSGSPPVKLSEILVQKSGANAHLHSFPGTYLASEVSTAISYAGKAAELFGGEPLLITARIPLMSLIPDEDEVHCQLGATLRFAFDPENRSSQDIIPFTEASIIQNAPELARDLIGRLDMVKNERIGDVADCLRGMLLATLERAGDWPVKEVFDDRYWAEPAWVKVLTSDAAGLNFYREQMDRLCHSLVGIDPDGYPCGWESCRGRVLEGIPLACPEMADVPMIVAIGTPDDPAAYFDERDRIHGARVLDFDYAVQLSRTAALAPC